MSPDTLPSRNARRDLELILLGLSLSKSGRQPVLDAFPRGTLTDEVDVLLDAVRTGIKDPFLNWLKARECPVSEGREIHAAIIWRVADWNQRRQICDVIGKLSFASKLETTTELKDRVKSILHELEELTK